MKGGNPHSLNISSVYCVWIKALYNKKNMELLDRIQRSTTSMKKGLENLSYEGRLRKLGQFSWRRGGSRGTRSSVYKYTLKEGAKRTVRCFSVVPSNITTGSEHKEEHRMFSLNSRKHLFTVRVPEYCHSLLRKVVPHPPWDQLERTRTCAWTA